MWRHYKLKSEERPRARWQVRAAGSRRYISQLRPIGPPVIGGLFGREPMGRDQETYRDA